MEDDEINRMWSAPLEDLGKAAAHLYAGGDAPLFKQYAALLDARVAVETRAMARATKRMALATAVMALATLTVGGVTWWTADGAAETGRKSSCIEAAHAWIALADYAAPAFPDMNREYTTYRNKVLDPLRDRLHNCED